jgi:hypothetical protein
VGKPLNRGEINQFACQNAVMELGRLSFAERMENQLRVENLLKKQIFQKKQGSFYQGQDTDEISFTEFLRMIDENNTRHSGVLKNWLEDINSLSTGILLWKK